MAMCYPLFLQPGKLRALNELAFKQIGFPLFLCATERSRPGAEDVVGTLYEVVTGLYVVYHDYGSRILKEFCSFCDEQNMVEPLRDQYAEERKQDLKHQRAVNSLRAGFCHGIFPDTGSGKGYVLALRDLTGIHGFVRWPEFPSSLSRNQCNLALKNLSQGADKLYHHLWQDIGSLAERNGALDQFRDRLKNNLLNSNQPKWGEGYFDRRVINQVRGGARDLPVADGMIVRYWLRTLVDDLQRREIESTDAPITRLQEIYRQVRRGDLLIDRETLAEARWGRSATRSSGAILGADLEF